MLSFFIFDLSCSGSLPKCSTSLYPRHHYQKHCVKEQYSKVECQLFPAHPIHPEPPTIRPKHNRTSDILLSMLNKSLF